MNGKTYKICVYAICKNEEKFVDAWMDSMGEADLVVVTDTGSTDGTVEKLHARGAAVYPEKIDPWRFDTARNLSLSHVPEDADICVCTDLDEIFTPGWRACLEKAWLPGTTSARYLYNWSHRPDGSPDTQFYYFKIHSRADYRWVYPIHECLEYRGDGPEKLVFVEGMALDHYPDPQKSRGSYLPLLELAVRENPQDARMAYYLGREYLYRGRWEDCVDALKRHLELPGAAFTEERCASMRWIAASCRMLGKTEEAYRWYFRAIAEAPFLREPYVEFAQLAYTLEDWPAVLFLTEQALLIREKSRTYVNSGGAWDQTPNDLCAVACCRLGMHRRALAHARAALALAPDDKRLQDNVTLLEKLCLPF